MLHLFTVSGARTNAELKADQSRFQLSPLTKSELTIVKEELKPETKQPISDYEQAYYSSLNENPILIYFTKPNISLDEFIGALKKIRSITLEKKETNLVALSGPLQKILSEISEENRGNYCIVAAVLLSNLEGRTKALKLFTSLAGLPLLFKSATGKFVKNLGRDVVGLSSFFAIDTFIDSMAASEILTFNLSVCLKAGFENIGTRMCDFEETTQYASKIKESLFYLPATGTPKIFKDDN